MQPLVSPSPVLITYRCEESYYGATVDTSRMPETQKSDGTNTTYTPVEAMSGRPLTDSEPDLFGHWPYDINELLDSTSLEFSWFTSQSFID
jgi:hypothetical protein